MRRPSERYGARAEPTLPVIERALARRAAGRAPAPAPRPGDRSTIGRLPSLARTRVVRPPAGGSPMRFAAPTDLTALAVIAMAGIPASRSARRVASRPGFLSWVLRAVPLSIPRCGRRAPQVQTSSLAEEGARPSPSRSRATWSGSSVGRRRRSSCPSRLSPASSRSGPASCAGLTPLGAAAWS